MSEETLWTRAYGDEYWADVTSPLFFSLVGEYLTEYVNHEGARIMGYREIADNCVCGSLGAGVQILTVAFGLILCVCAPRDPTTTKKRLSYDGSSADAHTNLFDDEHVLMGAMSIVPTK